MSIDPVKLADCRSWFEKAAEDLRAGEFEMTASPPLTTDIVFHAQQAAEKAMKGFLSWNNKVFRKTHNLIELGEQCVFFNTELEPLLRKAAPLTEYAWKFRYPGDVEHPEKREAQDALHLAREVYEALLQLVPELKPKKN